MPLLFCPVFQRLPTVCIYCSVSVVRGYLSEEGEAAVVAALFRTPLRKTMYVLYAATLACCVWQKQRVV